MEDIHATTLSRTRRKQGGKSDLSCLNSTPGYRIKRALLDLYRGICKGPVNCEPTPARFSTLSIAQGNSGILRLELAHALGAGDSRLVSIIDIREKPGLAERRRKHEDRRGA
ncbi:MAG: hypothetical protein OXC66_14435 [Roseovarius sp.]|nr:hypothetical protein [Roseovarius sp.]